MTIRAKLYAGPHDGAVAKAPAAATTIRIAGELYRRTMAVDRDGRPIYQHQPAAPTTPQERRP